MEIATFTANKLATTVGANSLAAEVVVPQLTIKIPVAEEVEYEFDQQKFEEYVSSSSSRSASPCRCRNVSSSQKIRRSPDLKNQEINLPIVNATVVRYNGPPTSNETRSADLNSFANKESTTEGALTLSKRARQRQRQHLARQFAKALDQMDGLHYQADLELRKRQVANLSPRPASESSSRSPINEWVRVQRTRSTLEERTQKRRALSAQARAQVQEARRRLQKEVAKKPPPTHQNSPFQSNLSILIISPSQGLGYYKLPHLNSQRPRYAKSYHPRPYHPCEILEVAPTASRGDSRPLDVALCTA
uniref:Uncharacterized protein n=1 Tax=Asparagus officinalis TaxID=4686 RepID=Q2XNU3_ASPOF|nr:hypothetical protein 12.t00047 [Asparagus officinalis]